ncbi:MAG: B12-binding domain-containing radical SAM protein [Limisphaerales bacterium]
MKRVLFVVPRSFNPKQTYREYPLGVGFIGTVLREHGYEVAIFDQNAEGEDDELLWQTVRTFAPEVVGFSVITPNYPVARAQIAEFKRRYPETLVLAGGIHVNLFPEDLLADGVDYAVLGEGEYSTLELLDRLAAGGDVDGIHGIALIGPSGIRKTPRQPTALDLDALPFVDRGLYKLQKYTHHSMVASRGCPYRCSFCCNYTGTVLVKGVAVRSHEKVMQEMQYLEQAFGAKEVFFADDIFLLRKSEILAFAQTYVQNGLRGSWIGQMRADTIDREVAEAMAAANCRRVYFGIESGSDEILARANKRMTTTQLLAGVSCAKGAGIRVKTGWIYGLPGSVAEQRKSIEFMRRMRPHEISIHQLIPFPGTPYYQRPADFGIRIRDPKDFESFCYGGLGTNVSFDYMSPAQLIELLEETVEALEREGYVSSDRATAADQFIYTTPLNRNSMTVFRSGMGMTV